LTQALKGSGGIGACNQELFSQRGGGLVPDICGCLSDGAHNGGGLNGQDAYTGRIIPVQTYDMRGNGDGETVGTLTGDHAGRPTDYTPVVAFERRFVRTSGGQPSIELNPCLRADANTGDGAPCVAYGFTTKESGKDAAADIIPPLRAESGDPHMGGRMAVAFGGDIARTLSARHDSSPCADRGMDVVATGMQVRRLTPRECEALQGLPRNWTLIPIKKVKRNRLLSSKKNVDDEDRYVEIDGEVWQMSADGPRYKGIGNGQTVNVMRWLAERIKKAIAV
jgi:site-specific DNA-cytosine methylase